MKKLAFFWFLGIVFGFAAVYSGHCENRIVGGQLVDDSGFPVINSLNIEPLANGTLLSFDDMAPCFFEDTAPVRPTYYKKLGFTIKGPDADSGGAVLNVCSEFDVMGYSYGNFLAFNCNVQLSTGGVPFLPEKLIFTNPVSGVSLKIGSGLSVGEHIALTAKTATGKVVDSEIVILAPALATVDLTSTRSNIKRVEITLPAGSNACAFVIDDIATTP